MIQFLWLIWMTIHMIVTHSTWRGIGNSDRDRDTMYTSSSINARFVFMECRSGKEWWSHPPRPNDSNGARIDVVDIIGKC